METGLAVTGMGLVTCLGLDTETNWQALVRGDVGFRPVTSFDTSGGVVHDGGIAPEMEGCPVDRRDRASAYLVMACREALHMAGLSGTVPDPDRAALFVGSSLAAGASGDAFWESFLSRSPRASDFSLLRSYDVEPLLDGLCETLDVRGEGVCVSNACAAGASSLCLAADAIRLGRADLAVACGYDALDIHTFAGFASIRALACGGVHPFSPRRAGMKLSDGFACILIEREDKARLQGRKPLARLVGYGESADAHHLTQPHPEGAGAALAMRRALDMAGIRPAAVDYVNLHATATQANDLAEVRAMRTVFGDHLPRIYLHAVKPALGHSLGGSGAVEAVITLLVLAHQVVPPTAGLEEIEAEATDLRLPRRAEKASVRVAMSNAFGFGGCNASLVFEGVGDA